MKKYLSYLIWAAVGILTVLVFARVIFFRIDLTEERRYSLSTNSKTLLKDLQTPVEVTIYLGGEADANIVRLRRAINELIDELNAYSAKKIRYRYADPSAATSEEERYKNYDRLEQKGLQGMTVSRRSRQGSFEQQIIFPWAEVALGSDTMPVCLMQPAQGIDIAENVNHAIEMLEYGFLDAIRILSKPAVDRIAFLEGHDELSELEDYDASDIFSRYFQVDRGMLGSDASVLDSYRAVVIAKPLSAFSESDKYIIDQYIMRGGRVFWLLDAIIFSADNLSKNGFSPVAPLELNLTDMLFRYGVRIEPSVVQDRQCLTMPVNVARHGETPQFEAMPWTYAPLLLTSPHHPITKNGTAVKSDFPSVISQTNDENSIVMMPLLVTSNASRVDRTPTEIDLKNSIRQDPETYFRHRYLPIAVVMEGEFPSVFAHRMPPKGIDSPPQTVERSVPTRMVVAADGDIIRNDVEQQEDGTLGILPLGFDRMTGRTFGNRDFVLNALLYLTDDDGWMQLRNRSLKLRLLNSAAVSGSRHFRIWWNVAAPPLLLLLLGGIYLLFRRKMNKSR
ncbi:MAG: gliding motility-associated ABC transporter substrate-binding protein GldG [Prevotellaceae bacterium]|nr:gliding motility-associated ABC transporter substrate-binding protein GldG [Prevotellaceae bacterium]